MTARLALVLLSGLLLPTTAWAIEPPAGPTSGAACVGADGVAFDITYVATCGCTPGAAALVTVGTSIAIADDPHPIRPRLAAVSGASGHAERGVGSYVGPCHCRRGNLALVRFLATGTAIVADPNDPGLAFQMQAMGDQRPPRSCLAN